MREYYVGSPALTGLLARDPRERLFHRIHNSKLAHVLLKGLPGQSLDDDKVEGINRVLEAHFNDTVDDFENFDLYKDFVEKVKEVCRPGDDGVFYEAFGLDRAGNSFQDPQSLIPNEIAQQIEYNTTIVYRAQKWSDYKTPLMSYFLTLEKDKEAAPGELKDSFENAANLEQFIHLMKSEEESGWSSKYQEQISSDLFKALKEGAADDGYEIVPEAEDEEGEFLANDEDENEVLDLEKIKKSLNSVHDKMKDPIISKRDRFKFLLDVEPIHLYNPAFRGAALKRKEEMKAYYKELLDDNRLILDQIKRQCNELERLKQEMEAADLEDIPVLQQSAYDKLYANLEIELASAYQALDFHEQVRDQLSDKDTGIIKTLDEALESRKAYLFHDEGVTRTVISRDALSARKPIYADLSVGHSIEIMDEGNVSKLVLGDRDVKPSEVEVVDMVFQEGAIKIGGSYSVDYHVAGHVSVKGDLLSKAPGGRFEVRQFPKLDPAVPDSREARGHLLNAKIKFAMTMAAEVLANMDAPPTKDRPLRVNASQEDMEFLWTALVVLGESNSKMKFGPEAIKINRLGTCNFKPEETIVPFLNIRLGWKKSAMYEHMKANQQEHIESLETVTKQKFGASSEDKRTIGVLSKKMTQHEEMKGDLQSFRKEAQKTIDDEGDAPDPTRSMSL